MTDKPTPQDAAIYDAYRKAAKELHEDEGTCEIDDNALVSMGEDRGAESQGAYVQAWVWVSWSDAGLCRSCGIPYDGCGDGWDGECPDCADKNEALRTEEEDDD